MTDDEIIAVVMAHQEGKQIQVLAIHSDLGWQDCENPSWDFRTTNYRVAPEPRKPREWWASLDSDSKGYIFPGKDVASTIPQGVSQTEREIIHVREVIE